MTPELLRQIGEALYGPNWQAPLARDLGVRDQTVRRWRAGSAMPEGLQADLRALLTHTIEQQKGALAALEKALAAMGT